LRALGIETSGTACRVAKLEVKGKPCSYAEVMRTARVVERNYSGDAARHSEALWGLLDSVLTSSPSPRVLRGYAGREAAINNLSTSIAESSRPEVGVRGPNGKAGGRLSIADFDVIAVSLGPGSFTGLRVGLAAAKVFAQFGGVALAGVPTLEAMAAEASLGGEVGWCVTALDAKRGEVYAALFRCLPRGVRKVAGPRVCLPEDAARRVPPGTPVLAEPPRASAVAALGLLRFLAGKRDDPRTLVPLYVRRPEAVERLRKKRKA